jgi:HlyD family secretion protein
MDILDAPVTKPSETSQKPDPKPPRHQSPWRWILILLLTAAIGGAAWRFLTPSTGNTQLAATQSKPQPPRAVAMTTLAAGEATRKVQLLGQVESRQQATIRSRTSGIVQQILIQPGDRVTQGMTIAILDDADRQVELSEAKARLAQQKSNLARLEVGTRPEIIAQRRAALSSTQAREKEAQDDLQRTTDLVKEGARSQRNLIEARSALDDATGARLEAEGALAEAIAGPIREEIAAQRANVEAAAAAVNRAEINLQRIRVRAMTNGVVQQRRVSPGDYVESADEIATLVAGDNLDVFLEVPEELSGSIRSGLPVQLSTRALPQWQGRATITGVVPAADTASRRQRVRVRLDNPPPGLLSGMAVTGSVQLKSDRPSFVISRDAVTRKQNRWFVYTVADRKAREIEVDLVADLGDRVAIYNKQLRSGQPIVLRGGDGLSNGTAVKVVRQKSQS